jgi:hypothetical protein
MSSKENAFGQLFSRVLRSQGAMVVPYVAGDHGQVGFPDKLVVHSRWTGLCELKAAETKTREIQKHVMRQIDARWPRHCFQVRMISNDMGKNPVVSVTRYSDKGDADMAQCLLGDLLLCLGELVKFHD